MSTLRFAMIGAGFWANYQLAAWKELKDVTCVAICDQASEMAESLARDHQIGTVYHDAANMFGHEQLDFVDIVTGVESHAPLVYLAAAHKIPVICQKPMAGSLEAAEQMVASCNAAGVPLLIHENWRWQAPIRRLSKLLQEGQIGKPVRARFRFVTSFDLFKNQPSLRSTTQLLLGDLGVHILDTARFLFGEAERLYCQTQRVRPDIQGEDMATITMKMKNGMTTICELAYAGIPMEQDVFPQTCMIIEGTRGSVELGPNFQIKATTENGTQAEQCQPPYYAWSDPAYAVVHSSIVPCSANLRNALRGQGAAETTGEDQLKTMRLVFASYESCQSGRTVTI